MEAGGERVECRTRLPLLKGLRRNHSPDKRAQKERKTERRSQTLKRRRGSGKHIYRRRSSSQAHHLSKKDLKNK